MHKILIKLILISFLFINNSFSEIISKINITGNKRISNETILVLGNIQIGNNFGNNELNNSLKQLLYHCFLLMHSVHLLIRSINFLRNLNSHKVIKALNHLYNLSFLM